MTQLPVRKIAACFNNICFWRERKPLQWATFAHIQSGRTGVTTLLREVHAAEEELEAGVGAQGVNRLHRSQFFRIFRACAEVAAGLNIFLAATARPG